MQSTLLTEAHFLQAGISLLCSLGCQSMLLTEQCCLRSCSRSTLRTRLLRNSMFTETLWFHMTHAILWVQFFAEVCIYGTTYTYIHMYIQTDTRSHSTHLCGARSGSPSVDFGIFLRPPCNAVICSLCAAPLLWAQWLSGKSI